MRRFILATTALVATVTLVACQPQTSSTQPSPSPASAVVEVTPVPTPMADGTSELTQLEARVIQVNGDNFTFDVPEIRAKQGEKLSVNFTNTEGFHDFVIDELGVNTGMVQAGSSKEVMIPTDKPGTYEYYCSVGSHRQMGMKGTLIIE